MIIGVVELIDYLIAESKDSKSVEIEKVTLRNAKGNLLEALKMDGITGIRGDVKVNSHE